MTANISFFAKFDPQNSSSEHEEIGEVCIANISPLERKKRLKFGIGQFVVTLVVLVALMSLGVDPAWRLLLFFMFSAATVSCFQAFDKT